MAGYAMDLGEAGAQYAQGVTMPSATELGASAQAIEGIGRGLFSVMDSMVSSGKQKTQASIDREMYGSFAKRLQELKGQEGLTLRSSVNSLISEYSAQGFEIDANASKLIKMQTGIDVDYLNVNPQQEALNLVSKKIAENPAYLVLAEQTLAATGKPYTERDVLIEAMGQVQVNEAAALFVANSKNINNQKFLNSYVPQVQPALDNIIELGLMGMDIEIAGGNVSPQSIQQLSGKFESLKATIKKPPMVTDDNWQVIQRKIDNAENIIKSLESYDQEELKKIKAGIITPIAKSIALQAATMEDPAAAFAILSNLDKVSDTWMNRYLPEQIKLSKEILPQNIEFTHLPVFPELAEQVNQNVKEAVLTPTDVLHTQESITAAEKRTPKDRKEAIDFAYLNQVSLLTPDTMAEDFARENFVRGLEIISVNMITSPNIMDDATIAKIFSEDTFNKLRKLKQYDNDAYLVTKERIANALRFQKTAQSTAVYGALKDPENKFLTVGDQGQVMINEEAVATAYPTGEKVLFKIKDLANTYYNNDLMEMYRDLGRKIPMETRREFKGTSLDFARINEAVRKADKLMSGVTKYDELLRRLGAPVEVPTAGADYTEDNPYTFSGQTDEEQQVEFDQLPADSWFIDPDTGILAQK